MNDDVIVPLSIANLEALMDVHMVNGLYETLGLMVPDSLTGCKTGWITLQNRGRTSKYMKVATLLIECKI